MDYKVYDVAIETVGPVHVGSGETLNKMSFIQDKRTQKVFILDRVKFMKWVLHHGYTDSLEKFVLNKRGQSNADLYQWFAEERLPYQDQEFIAYTLSTKSLSLNKGLNQINRMIRNDAEHVYIPGSTLKGALRTAILAKKLSDGNYRKETSNLQNQIKRARNKNDFSNSMKQLEDKVFTYSVTDSKGKEESISQMKQLLVSDSRLIYNSDLILAQKIDSNATGYDNKIPTFREAIRPGVTLHFDLVLKGNDLSIDQIREALNFYYHEIDIQFLSYFQDEKAREQYIYLGGGTGYPWKTVTYFLGSDEKNRENVKKLLHLNQKRHYRSPLIERKDEDRGLPYRFKTTYYGREKLEMGLCKIRFEEK